MIEIADQACNRVAAGAQGTATALDEANIVFEALDRSDQLLSATEGTFAAFDEIIREVNQRVRVLSEIAEQSNILAVNATIESARAGERGKGFQVVADAMRALARQSAVAALEIGELLDEGSARIDRSVSGTRAESEASKTAISTARSALNSLRDATSTLTDDALALINAVRTPGAPE